MFALLFPRSATPLSGQASGLKGFESASRVHLELFMKVEEEWRNKQGLLDDMGIN
jgi:hypothetical protein